ncbi:integrase core domain-containing protein [Variovorax paradoxus]|uniref:integrase core domain-containing protein n=1 Tax=Variovorax paradoxus TaxID=34073 RepID=UPI002781679A|nr:integrase core domain-containing protein [Variovorax paradoxus]MDP9933512.1 transposase InsO family protein [Variovorax paradoxus]
MAEYIKAHALEIAERRRAMRRRPPRFFAVGHTWALDLTFVVNAQGFTFAMLGILDHGSRRLLCLKQLPRKCTLTLLGHLLLTMARCGVPAVIRTDNESMFASTLWRLVLAALGVCHRRSRPGCPWQNGRIERLFGTLKPLLRAIKPNSVMALKAALAEFSWFYNHVRVHQNLKGLTPMEAWHGRTLADVQRAHTHGTGRWVPALEEHLTGHYVRCW